MSMVGQETVCKYSPKTSTSTPRKLGFLSSDREKRGRRSLALHWLAFCFVLLITLSSFVLSVRYAGGEPPPEPDPPTFEHTIIDSGGKGRVAIGDINGDGYNDFALHTWRKDISWYRYPNWEKYIIASDRNIRGDEITIVDLDGDGDNDIVGAYNDDGKNVYWFENPGGTGVLWPRHDVSRRKRGMFDLLVARDMNSDGLIDLVGTRGNSGNFDGVFWLEQVRTPQPVRAFTPARENESEHYALP